MIMHYPGCSTINPDCFKGMERGRLEYLFTTMVKIRLVEQKVAQLVEQGEVRCPCHLYEGQEAVASGVCLWLDSEDLVFSTHRSHGHFLAKGGGLKEMMAEIFCRQDGCSSGWGGSMHLRDQANGLLGSSAIVAGTVPLAVGAALAAKMKGGGNVAVAFFGDGAMTEGVVAESMNLAALLKVPAIFVCENNFYSSHMAVEAMQANSDLSQKAAACGMAVEKADGNNVGDVSDKARRLIEAARQGGGPFFLECHTYRWRGHVGPNYDTDKGLRSQKELDAWMEACPLERFRDYLVSEKIMSHDEIGQLIQAVSSEVDQAVSFAQNSPHPSPHDYF